MRFDLVIILQLRQDLPRQLFAQLNPPLIKREDVPDHPLHKDLMLVHRNETAQCTGRELPEHDGVGRPIAVEDAEGKLKQDLLLAHATGSQFFSHFLFGFANHQRFRLREEV